MRRSTLCLLLLLVTSALAGCGNKGPLTLPRSQPAAATTAPVPAAPASVPDAPDGTLPSG